MTDSQDLSELADRHLPPEIAAQWKALLRPAVQFDWAAGSDVIVAQLGGDPEMPPGEPWPEWEDYGPLNFIASFDCARITIDGFPLPEAGRLLFFYFDGQVDGGEEIVGVLEPGTEQGARVLYLPEGTATERRSAPEPLKPYPRQLLRAEAVVTAPEPDSPRILAAFGDRAGRGSGHPVAAEEFIEAVYEEVSVGVCHQTGGYPLSVQGPVEYEAAQADGSDPGQWLLLAQFDSDDNSDMLWGDAGVLYWLIREPDLAARRFDRAVFTWQCC